MGRSRREIAARCAVLAAEGRTRPEVARVLATEENVNMRVAMRWAHGWTQEKAAEAWNRMFPGPRPMTGKTISAWEVWPSPSGNEPKLENLDRLARVYGCTIDDLVNRSKNVGSGLLEDEPPPAARDTTDHEPHDETHTKMRQTDPVFRRSFLSLLGVGTAEGLYPPSLVSIDGGALGRDDVSFAYDTLRDLDVLDQQTGGARVYRVATGFLAWMRERLRVSGTTNESGRQFYIASGHVSASVGWSLYDCGRNSEARSFLDDALRTAADTDDPSLAGRTRSIVARRAVDVDTGTDAVRAAQAGLRRVRGTAVDTAHVRAVMAIREAQGWAKLGDRAATDEALGRAWREYGEGPRDEDPPWTLFLTEAELVTLEGMCRLSLGETARAGHLLRSATGLADPFTRNRTITLTHLANAAATRGDLDEACEVVRRIAGQMPTLRSVRVITQVQGLKSALNPHRSSSDVADTLELLDSLGL